MEDPLEELVVLVARDLEHPQRGPRVHRRVDVAERPLVGGQLAVRVHVPLAAEQDQLRLRELGVDVRERDAVEGEVPGRVPGVLPRVRHRDHVELFEVASSRRCGRASALGRRRAGRVAVEPALDVVVVELLRPEHPGEGLAQDERLVGGSSGRRQLGVELVGLGRARAS